MNDYVYLPAVVPFEEPIVSVDRRRRQGIIEWRTSVQAALEGSTGSPGGSDAATTTFDISRPESTASDEPFSSSHTPPPPTPSVRRGPWRSRLSVSHVWPWLSRTSHSCGHALLLAVLQSTSLAAGDGNYRDSFNALGIDTVEYQWQTWNVAIDGSR